MVKESIAPRLSPLAALVISLIFGTIIITLDIVTGPDMNLAIFKTVALMVAAATRKWKFLWIMTGLLIITTFTVMLVDLQSVTDTHRRYIIIVNRLFNAMTLLLVGGILTGWIRADFESQRTARELEDQNRELASRDQEITRQNLEMHSQAEALERQSETLKTTNADLAHREQMLESLLDLARSMRVGIDADEAMERICQTLCQLVDSAGTATAIILRDGEQMRIRCHSGFGAGGPQQEWIPAGQSFANLIFEQRRSGSVQDLALRPELRIPQPRDGEPLVSVLATPLVVRQKAIGVLEVYSRRPQIWSDGQVALAESLAAQTSISLENAQLFDEVDAGKRRLETILESIPVGLAVASAGMRNVRLNAAGAGLLGVPPDTNIADEFRRMSWRLFADGRPQPLDRYPIARALAGERVYPHEIEVGLASGRRLNLLSSAAPFHDAGGKIIGAVSSFVDISELKQLQRELETRRREAEEASVRKTRFLAAASHDIRTPANAISLLAELLKRSADSPSMAAEIPQLADELRISASALVNLVSNVLDVTRFDTDKLELHQTEFPLSQLLEEEARQMLPLAQAKQLNLQVVPPADSLWLRADRIKLGRVLGNLLGNAIKFTDRGGIQVVTERVDETGVRIAVIDTGVGINPEHRSHIFDEFWQLSDGGRSKGSGLGLSISQRLIQAMGGTLSVQSEIGVGSTFSITLPSQLIFQRSPGEVSGLASS